ncbi:porin [uncultured Thiodictyon sp.]|uniref:porin n=1 Tax=uncultured Thiodictyon sp. TaxID=1846217 RepID=UPI0025D0315A|nr:porin [uncultured Thiodictyon sp.]
MNKNLLTLAVAAALAVPAVASAEAILYGKLNVSLDYVDVERNATFHRPGQEGLRPQFNFATFKSGTSANYDTLSALGTYPAQRWPVTVMGAGTGFSGDPNNALNYNRWRGQPVPGSAASTAFMPTASQGSQVTRFLNPQAQAAYYQAAAISLKSAYPLNAQNWAQLAGATALANGYNYSPAQVITTADQAGVAAYNARLAQGATAAQASVAAADAYDKIAGGAWNSYQANLASAQNMAVATVAPLAGAYSMNAYFAGQHAKLTSDLQIGNVTQAYYNNATARLNQLQTLAYAAAVNGSYKAGQSFKGWGLDLGNNVNGPADRLGVKGSEDLGNGLKAVYQIEIGVDISNANRDTYLANGNRGTTVTNSGFSFRNTFIGLAGDWGTFLMGRHDTPMKVSTAKLDLFADTLADANATIGFQDLRADSAVAYISPSWSGFQIAAAIVPQGGGTALGALDQNADSIAGAYSVAAIYKNGPFYGSVAYEALDKSNWESQNADYMVLYQDRTAKSDTKVRVGLGLLDWNGFTLTGIYEQRQNIMGAPTQSNGNFFQVSAGYAFGNNMVKAMWGRADLDNCADPNAVGFRYTCEASALGQYFASDILVNNKQKSSFAIGYDYNFSKRTAAFLLYTKVSDKIENSDWSGFSIGMNHSF